MSHENVKVVIEYIRPLHPPKVLDTAEMMRVGSILSSRLRHRKSKILSSEEIARIEEKIQNRVLAKSVR